MKIRCPHCQQQTEIDDTDVAAYIKRITPKNAARSAAGKLNGSKPRPGSIGNTRAKKKID